MKSILYAGATFMLAAGIYGFTEMNTEKPQPTFNSLYTGPSIAPKDPIPAPVIVPFDETGNPVYINEAGIRGKKKQRKKMDINYKLFSRASLIEDEEIQELAPLPESKFEKKDR